MYRRFGREYHMTALGLTEAERLAVREARGIQTEAVLAVALQ